jgi:hypothetical protein
MKLIVAALALVLLIPATAAADFSDPHLTQLGDGWTLMRADPSGDCIVSGPTDGAASLSLLVEGPAFLMMVQSRTYPQGQDSYDVELSFDDGPVSRVTALGKDGILGIGFGDDQARTLVAATHLTVRVGDEVHTFSLKGAAVALDAASICAGQPTLAKRVEPKTTPIVDGGRWLLSEGIAGGAGCSAKVRGDQIDTIILVNNDGELVLLGGHSDWSTWGGPVPLALAIDDAPPVHLTATTALNLIAIRVQDAGLLARLRAARALDWTIPTGHVRGEVTGLGAAMDAVKACDARLAAAH